MSTYVTEHAGALADILAAGASATITVTVQSHTESTDAVSPTDTSMTGAAVRVTGDPKTYRDLSMTEQEAATLLFAPTTYGDESALKLGAKITSSAGTGRIRAIWPIKPGGSLIMARLVVQVA